MEKTIMKIISRVTILIIAIAAFSAAAIAQGVIIDENATPIERIEPVWPADTTSMKAYAGRVSVFISLDNAGNVLSVDSVSGPGSLCASASRPDVDAVRNAARDAAAQTRFKPAMRDGVAVSSTRQLDYEFVPTGGAVEPAPVMSVKEKSTPPDYKGPVNTGTIPDAGSLKIISGGVLNGKAVSLPKPPYPPAARAVRAAGAVSVQILIMEDGSVFSAAPVSGHPLLRSVSQFAACGAQFAPTRLTGNPVKVSGVVTYNFVP